MYESFILHFYWFTILLVSFYLLFWNIFRWAAQGLEFLLVAIDPVLLDSLSDEEFRVSVLIKLLVKQFFSLTPVLFRPPLFKSPRVFTTFLVLLFELWGARMKARLLQLFCVIPTKFCLLLYLFFQFFSFL